MKAFAVVVLLALIAPVWRDPAWSGGINGIQALWWLLTQPPKEHIPVEEALAEARAAWQAAHPG
jgi:hypothetical protein